ncbi:phospholipase C/P1 nuclease domain-containing protein, partial [Ephemerocybe angulata]
MRLSQSFVVLAAVAAPFIPTSLAFGAAGHEIVATIAQIHLHPSVLPIICDLLDVVPSDNSEATLRRQCHLASVATWADRDKYKMRWSAALHYVGAVDDHPSARCLFPGEGGWAGSKGINVLDGIKNVTSILGQWSGASEEESTRLTAHIQGGTQTKSRFLSPRPAGPREEEAFKFLVHFLGDMHQPLHLTGRDRGGNNQKVVFENRQTNLHSAWDGAILTRLIRTVDRKYSHPLPDQGDLPIPSAQIEAALRHAIYDPLIRRVMWEGVESKWIDEIDDWFACPIPAPIQEPEQRQSLLSVFSSDPLAFPRALVSTISSALREKVEISPDGPLICPYAWSVPLHQLNCKYVWPAVLNFTSEVAGRPPVHKYPVLDTPEYIGALDKDLVMEKLVAQGGLRLAGVLNWLFAD